MNILDIEMQENDAKAKTIKEYLKKLLLGVWIKEESFNGKRPFGNSGWKYEVYVALARAKAISADMDDDNYIQDISLAEEEKANNLIAEAINSL